MQLCFKTRDVYKLQALAASMDIEQFEYHLQRCIDSGLWVADANKENATANETKDTEHEYSAIENERPAIEIEFAATENQPPVEQVIR